MAELNGQIELFKGDICPSTNHLQISFPILESMVYAIAKYLWKVFKDVEVRTYRDLFATCLIIAGPGSSLHIKFCIYITTFQKKLNDG